MTPKPVQQPPRITMGGASPASARRAARIADEYRPIHPGLWRHWRQEMEALGKDPEITTRVDPALLGGIKVKVGSRLFDASLKSKLDSLKFALKRA